MLVILCIVILLFGIMFYFLNPKKTRNKDLASLLINRATIAFMISALILGISILNLYYWSGSAGRSDFRQFIDIILGIPILIPFILGFGAGEGYGYLALAAELLILTWLIRLLIPQLWPDVIIEKFKKTQL